MGPIIWDPETRLPTPPIDAVYNDTVGFWAMTVYLIVAAPVILYALWHSRERTGRIMLLIIAGGALCALVEPFADIVGGCWHPEVGQPTVFSLLGRGIPPYVCAGYLTYFGAFSAVTYLFYTRGITRRWIWTTFFVAVVIDIGMENLMVSMGLYHYYGNQPLNHLGWLPLWWPPINALGEAGGVAAVCFLLPHLKGWRLLLIPLILPLADLMSYALIAYPGIVAVNSPELGPLLTDLLGLGVWVLALVVVHGLSLLVATDSPLRKGNTVHLPVAVSAQA